MDRSFFESRWHGTSATHTIGLSITVIMAWDLWKSLASALLYIGVFVCPSSEALFFFGHLLACFYFIKRHSFDKLRQLL
jgi:hypothetical protein